MARPAQVTHASSALLAALAILAVGQQVVPTSAAGERIEQAWPDGKPRVRTQARREGEQLVPHGLHQRWHENGELAAEGHYVDGLLRGPWSAWYPDGSLLAKGEFLDGRRSGRWELHHDNGQLAAVGAYLLDCRDGRWVYFTADGTKDESESGMYRLEKEAHENRARRTLGETLDGVRHGAWTTWWDNGALQCAGAFRHGVRSGWWELYHLDGSLEPELVTGWYESGARVADRPPPDLAPDPFLFPEEIAAEPAIEHDLSRVPRAQRSPGVRAAQRETMRGWLALFRDGGEDDRRKAELLLVQYKRDVVPEVLEELRLLDPADAASNSKAEALNEKILLAITRGRGFAWRAGTSAEDAAANRLTLLRWFTWWELAREDDRYWSELAEAQAGVAAPLVSIELLDGEARAAAPAGAPSGAAPERSSRLFEARRSARPDLKVTQCVDRALEWLARHQAPAGCWSAAGFPSRCEADAAEPCGGLGNPVHDVGISSLALLALQADGNTASNGPYSEVVGRALGWLLSQQDPETGLFGTKTSHDYLYGHAIATLAVAEAAQYSTAPETKQAVEAAVGVILSARNPKAAWRYEWPSQGNNDTSITAWMVAALFAADKVGVGFDSGARAGASWWLKEMTDPATARIGYTTKGSLSARVAHTNDSYPPELGEALTAAGLHAFYQLGERPESMPMLTRQAQLLLAKPPDWRADGRSNDFYYWFHGASALRQVGGKTEQTWRDALERALLGAQRREPCREGSWDPIGPWGFVGGRVYATAMGALALAAAWREPRLDGKR